jgi:hypothetical protein
MSISSDVTITREQAEARVKAKLLDEYEYMITIALKAMQDFELTQQLHTDTYFYHIEEKKRTKK